MKHRDVWTSMIVMIGLAGCATTTRAPALRTIDPAFATTRPMVAGDDGTTLDWSTLRAMVDAADVVVIGEQHDDAVGHAVQTEIVRDTGERWPALALTLEMIERDEQTLLDDYHEEIIDAKQFARLTHSENWGARGMWHAWYQPTIDAAFDAGGTVYGANAPRRYVRLARTDGYERLDTLGGSRRAMYDLPPEDDVPAAYRDRFHETMGSLPDHTPDTELIDASFRSQLVWDATMSGTMAAALDEGASKVIHLVGRFHSDFNGGTVALLRQKRPDLHILTISLQPSGGPTLREEDRGRADVIIYTGR